MDFKVFENEIEASKEASKIIIDIVKNKNNAVLGLATGSTPVNLYKEMILDYQKNNTNYTNVVTFNLDEYVGLDNNHIQSYRYFMDTNLFNFININKANTFFPEINQDYDKLINQHNKMDILVLGIGTNGHIGFNEPGSSLDSLTRVVDLDESTIKVNANKFFDGNTNLVPKQAISMGLKTILEAKKIILLAFGQSKKDAINKLKNTKSFDINFPASALINHNDVTVFVDKIAYEK